MTSVLQKAKELVNKAKNLSPEEKLKYLDEVGKIRGEIFKNYRGKKMPQEVRQVLKELGKTFPPTLYRLRKKKKN